jgi:hypothetical protein
MAIELATDGRAGTPVACVRPEALIEIVRAAVSVGGAAWIRVTGKSMNPIIRHGDRVLIAASRRPPTRGAIMLLDAGGSPLLHRVVRVSGGSVVTKGDSRTVTDKPHLIGSIIGRAVVVRRGSSLVCLAPTLQFGVRPVLLALAWWVRLRLPRAWGIRLPRVRRYAR